KEKKDEKVLSEPETKVVLKGTKKKEEPADTGGSDSGDSGSSDSGDSGSGDSGDSGGDSSTGGGSGGGSGSGGGDMSNGKIDARPREQFERAKKLQAAAGWGQWACA